MNRHNRLALIAGLAIATLCVVGNPAMSQTSTKQATAPRNLAPPPTIKARLDLSLMERGLWSQSAAALITIRQALNVHLAGGRIQLVPGSVVRVSVDIADAKNFPSGSYSFVVDIHDFSALNRANPPSEVITVQQQNVPQVSANCPVNGATNVRTVCSVSVPLPATSGRVSQVFEITTNHPIGVVLDWVTIY